MSTHPTNRASSRAEWHRRAAAVLATACIALPMMVVAGCGGADTAQTPAGTEGVKREAATYRGTKVTLINSSSSPVQAAIEDGSQGRTADLTPLVPGATRVGAVEGGYFDGGSATTRLSWDEDVVTRRLVMIARNSITDNGLIVWSNVMDAAGEVRVERVPVKEPEAYRGSTSFEWDGHRIRVVRNGWDTYYYLWQFVIES